ncbi:MAG: exodeoxyribonuclease VII small subunit [Acidobacteria bacterium]|nr:exodeoxyribonuclease VII small subunit [Acidobacteriota bacterium]
MKMKDFESALKSLEGIVGQLEAGDLTLERALELFEEGIRISRFCSSKLEEAERKVEVLIKSADGALKEAAFTEQAQGNEDLPLN